MSYHRVNGGGGIKHRNNMKKTTPRHPGSTPGRLQTKRRPVATAWFLTLVLFFSPAPWGPKTQVRAAGPEAVQSMAEETGRIRGETRALTDQGDKEEASLQKEIHDLEDEIRSLERGRRKTEQYLAAMRQKTDRLKSDQNKVERLRDELGPLLDRTLEKLAAAVAAGPPYHMQKRTKGLETLRAALNDPDANLLQKTRRLLELLLSEINYGHQAETRETEVRINGRSVRVRLLHIGRVALLALRPDGRGAWRWDRARRAFVPVDRFALSIGHAVDMADRVRLMELVDLPLEFPQAREAEK